MSLLAQHGWGKSDKIENGLSNNSIKGVILSPKDERMENLENYISSLRQSNPEMQILIDPQFYYSTFQQETREGKLAEYPFHQKALGLSTFSNSRNLNEYVKNTLAYQAEKNLSGLVSPAIYMKTFSSREAQINLSLISEAVNVKIEEAYSLPIIASLIVHEDAFEDEKSMDDFLDGLSILEIDSVYLIIVRKNNGYHQSFANVDTLVNILSFIYSLSEINEFDVKMGYSDFVGLLYLAVGAKDIATGWSQGLRKFTLEQRVILEEGGGGRRPRLRYSSAPLLNSLLFSEMLEIKERFSGEFNEFLTGTSYDDYSVFNNPDLWNESDSLQHHWLTISNLTDYIISDDNILIRIRYLNELIDRAKQKYEILAEGYIQLDSKSRGTHLELWKIALEKFVLKNDL